MGIWYNISFFYTFPSRYVLLLRCALILLHCLVFCFHSTLVMLSKSFHSYPICFFTPATTRWFYYFNNTGVLFTFVVCSHNFWSLLGFSKMKPGDNNVLLVIVGKLLIPHMVIWLKLLKGVPAAALLF